jgi:ABC-type transporter Mla MlaB component
MVVDRSTLQGRVPITVFRIQGDIDAKTYEQLQSMAEEAVEGGARDILLDLTNVSYISSAGLRAIHYIYNLLRSKASDEGQDEVSRGLLDGSYKSRHLKLLCPGAYVSNALKTAGFDMYLDIYKDEKEATAAY